MANTLKDGFGAAWLASMGIPVGAFGARVADLLNWWADGIYHIQETVTSKHIRWTNEHWIQMRFEARGGWSTCDNSTLTRLVIAAHDRCIRIAIEPAGSRYLRLVFSPRQRTGNLFERHATIEEQIERARRGAS